MGRKKVNDRTTMHRASTEFFQFKYVNIENVSMFQAIS